jgi:hypothetical protein
VVRSGGHSNSSGFHKGKAASRAALAENNQRLLMQAGAVPAY